LASFKGRRYLYWKAEISPNGKRLYLGIFKSETDAARAYDAAAAKEFGDFARLNFPQEHGKATV
jgi:hypothetical protein